MPYPFYPFGLFSLGQTFIPQRTENGEAAPPQQLEPNGGMFEQLMLALIVVKLSKTPEGLRVIRELGREFLRGIFDTLHALGQASAANRIAAWANPYLIAMILRRFGFIQNVHLIRYELGISLLAGISAADDIMDTIKDFVPWNLLKPSGEPSEFPSNIIYSARSGGGQGLKETIKAEGLSPTELEQMRSLLAKKEG